MSFILKDNDLLKEFEKILYKTAQTIGKEQFKNTSLKLLKNLKQSYSPSSNITFDGDSAIAQKHIYNLVAFISYLDDSGAKFDGHRIVYKAVPPPAQITKAVEDKEIKYISNAGDQYVVWKDGLIGFLNSLRQQAGSSGNLYFQELTEKLIGEANATYNTNVSETEEKPQEEQPKQDRIPSNESQDQDVQQDQKYQNVGYTQQQAKESIEQTLKNAPGGSINIRFPYDLSTNLINFNQITIFMAQVNYLIANNPVIQTQLANAIPTLGSYIADINNNLNGFRTFANGTSLQAGGFKIADEIGTNADAFVLRLKNDYAKAKTLLLFLVQIFGDLNNTIDTLSSSPSLKSMFGENIFTEQVQRGNLYIQIIDGWISSYNSKLQR